MPTKRIEQKVHAKAAKSSRPSGVVRPGPAGKSGSLALFGVAFGLVALGSQLSIDNSLLFQVLFGGAFSLALIASLLRFSRLDGSRVSIMAYSIFFLNLFYTVRGAAFLLIGDSELALQVGVTDVEKEFGLAMSWFNCFLSLLVFGACIERQFRTGNVLPPSFVPPGGGRDDRTGFWLFLTGCIFLALNKLVARYVAIEGVFVIIVPFGFGLCLAGLGRWVGHKRGSRLAVHYAIAISLAFLVTYFTRGQFSARMYSFGVLAILGGFMIGHLRCSGVAMLSLIIIFPIIQSLGESRYVDVDRAGVAAANITQAKLEQGPLLFLLEPYTADSGDFTALDIFASTIAGEQTYRPWGLSFLYVFVHWIPRNIWPSKPEGGILTDEASFRLARLEFSNEFAMIPYDPGIVGTLYLEGGPVFILLGAIVLGFILSRWDRRIAAAVYSSRYRVHGCSLFAMAIFILFFTARFRPYQVFYLILSLHAGYYVGVYLYSRFESR